MESKEMDFREKRLNFIFKIIYIIALFFAILTLEIGRQFGNNLSTQYIIESGLATTLLVILGTMLSYIFNELKCLRWNEYDETQIQKTESAYLNVFNNIWILAIIILIITATECMLQKILSKNVTLIIFGVATVIWIILYIVSTKRKNINSILRIFSLICQTIAISIAFLYLGIE